MAHFYVLHVFTCYTISVNTQNVTLKLPTDALKRAKVAAAHRGTSLSALLAEKLEEAVGEDAEYEAARKRALRWLESGWHLGGHQFVRDPLRG
jgi:hypothetical protein